jgi:hypothetical protein
MPHEQLGLSNDELLSTTRAVRKRLDFDKPISEETIKECMELAVQAPTGSNAQGWVRYTGMLFLFIAICQLPFINCTWIAATTT